MRCITQADGWERPTSQLRLELGMMPVIPSLPYRCTGSIINAGRNH